MKITTDWIEPANHSVPCDPNNYKKKSSRNVEFIAMHYTANKADTALANCRYFQSAYRGASAHFFVDPQNIYQSVRLRDVAWHVGAKKYTHPSCRNDNSIGIEMCTSGDYKISEATMNRAAGLVAYLFIQFGWGLNEVDSRLLRHWDVTGKWCPAQMAGTANQEWMYFKDVVREKIAAAIAPPARPEVSSLVFNSVFYANRYPDLAKAGLTTPIELAEHFLNFGMQELRVGCETFNPVVYKQYNEDLRVAFGDDNPMYYLHYINYGHKENRAHV